MNTDEKQEKLEKTQAVYDKLLSRVSELCREAEEELKAAKS